MTESRTIRLLVSLVYVCIVAVALTLIKGIHGQPYAPWDGVETKPNANPNIGYCTHSVNLFAIWHRPYLSLFEVSTIQLFEQQ